jgi:hypothetical protein
LSRAVSPVFSSWVSLAWICGSRSVRSPAIPRVLAVVASHCRWCDGQRQRSGANRQSEEPHRIGLPTPSMRGPRQIKPIAA